MAPWLRDYLVEARRVSGVLVPCLGTAGDEALVTMAGLAFTG
jgi:hypothetical protein